MRTRKLQIQQAILHIGNTAFIFIALLFAVINLSGCRKEVLPKPAVFLDMQIAGDEEAIGWETITSKWDDSNSTLDLEASGYSFDNCSIHLRNIGTPIVID